MSFLGSPPKIECSEPPSRPKPVALVGEPYKTMHGLEGETGKTIKHKTFRDSEALRRDVHLQATALWLRSLSVLLRRPESWACVTDNLNMPFPGEGCRRLSKGAGEPEGEASVIVTLGRRGRTSRRGCRRARRRRRRRRDGRCFCDGVGGGVTGGAGGGVTGGAGGGVTVGWVLA